MASHGVTHQLGVGGRRPADRRRRARARTAAERGSRSSASRRTWRILDETVELVRENRHEILAVAHALETHKTLAGEDVVAVIEGTEGPLVDGRVYHDASAQEVLERYHEMAMTAHRDHAPVDTGLPELTNGHRPVVRPG